MPRALGVTELLLADLAGHEPGPAVRDVVNSVEISAGGSGGRETVVKRSRELGNHVRRGEGRLGAVASGLNEVSKHGEKGQPGYDGAVEGRGEPGVTGPVHRLMLDSVPGRADEGVFALTP